MTNPILDNVQFDQEGFMTNKTQWTKDIAVAIAEIGRN